MFFSKKKFIVFVLAAVCVIAPMAASATPRAAWEGGDSIAYGYCLKNIPAQQFGYLVARSYGMSLRDVGADGATVQTVQNTQVGTSASPRMVPNAYSLAITVVGTNDIVIFHEHPTTWKTMDQLILEHIALLQNERVLEPNAEIVDVGVRDLTYNDSRQQGASKAAFVSEIATYNNAIASWVHAQRGMVYVPMFPEVQYPQYYAKAVICGPWHPSAAGEPLIANAILNALRVTTPQ